MSQKKKAHPKKRVPRQPKRPIRPVKPVAAPIITEHTPDPIPEAPAVTTAIEALEPDLYMIEPRINLLRRLSWRPSYEPFSRYLARRRAALVASCETPCAVSICLNPADVLWFRSIAEMKTMAKGAKGTKKGEGLGMVFAEHAVCLKHMPDWRAQQYVPLGSPRPAELQPTPAAVKVRPLRIVAVTPTPKVAAPRLPKPARTDATPEQVARWQAAAAKAVATRRARLAAVTA